jgi:hypothetical protein
MIVEKIISFTLRNCCRKKETTSRGRFAMLQNVAANDRAFGYTEGDVPKTKIHPGAWTGQSDDAVSDMGRVCKIGIDEKKAVKPRPSFAMAMLDIHAISNYNDVGNLKEQIENLRRKSQATHTSPT